MCGFVRSCSLKKTYSQGISLRLWNVPEKALQDCDLCIQVLLQGLDRTIRVTLPQALECRKRNVARSRS